MTVKVQGRGDFLPKYAGPHLLRQVHVPSLWQVSIGCRQRGKVTQTQLFSQAVLQGLIEQALESYDVRNVVCGLFNLIPSL
jgi:hypothetical protein